MRASRTLADLPDGVGRPGAVIIVLVAVALAALLWLGARRLGDEQTARRSFAVETGTLPVAGLAAPVEVLRDSRGIPHIEAVRERDAWVALGFVHAQDRLAQMLWLRRLARGRTAEVVGEAGLVADRMARTLGLALHAEAQAERLDESVRDVLSAYAEGVNARLRRIRNGRVGAPLELAGAGETFDDWGPADSIAIVKLVAWSSSNLIETGIVLDDLIERLGSVLARPFKPTGSGVQGVEIPSELPLQSVVRGMGGQPRGELLAPSRDLIASTAIRGGSAWVLPGRYTESGAPILVADLHLAPTAPALVYEVHLRGTGVDVAGATIPGVPVIWAGRNLHVAWAATPARAVSVDLFKETIRSEDGLYQNGTLWVPLAERRELIRVRTAGGVLREEELVVRSTRHGPLINSLLRPPERVTYPSRSDAEADTGAGRSTRVAGSPPEREPLALAWSGALPGDGVGALLAVARARDAGQLVAALAEHHEPVVAMVYADDTGQAGMQLAGWLPRRSLPSGLVPVPGRLRLFDWHEPIEFSALPAVRVSGSRERPATRGPRSWVIAADGSLDDGLTAADVEWLWRTGERSRRLVAALGKLTAPGSEKVDLRSAAALQNDVAGSVSGEVIPALLRLGQIGGALRPEAREIAQLLGRWDGEMRADSRGAAAYHVLMEHLIEELLREPFGAELYARYLSLPGVRAAPVVSALLVSADRLAAPGGWTDVDRVSAAVRSSLRRTWVSLSYRLGPSRDGWAWGRLHKLVFRPFASLGRAPGRALGRLPAAALGGDETTLAVTAYERPGPYQVSEAATYRLAVDLAAPDRMLSSLSPGQSEHPQHPHFSDGLGRWLAGRPSLLLTSRLLVEEESGELLLLEPPQ